MTSKPLTSKPVTSEHSTQSIRRAVAFAVPFAYPVIFTRAVFDVANTCLVDVLPPSPTDRPQRVFCVVDGGLAAAQPDLVSRIQAYVAAHRERLELAGPVRLVAGGEQSKNDEQILSGLQRALATERMDRHSYCLVIGGGAVLDVVGFAAATVHRGVRLIRLPSTVLGQNDAGVGVKNGINAFGQKNFLGCFAPPFAVINDVTLLGSLPPRDLRAGMAEAVKVGLIRDAAFFEWLCEETDALSRFEEPALAHLVRRGAELHLDHIEGGGDPFEQGSSRPLDFGHWAAHKLEGLSHHALRHGEAVAIGIALDSLYSMASGWLSERETLRILRLLIGLGLPVDHPVLHSRSVDGKLLVAAGLDEFREHLGGQLSVTFLHGVGRGVTHNEVDLERMRQCIDWLSRLDPANLGAEPLASFAKRVGDADPIGVAPSSRQPELA